MHMTVKFMHNAPSKLERDLVMKTLLGPIWNLQGISSLFINSPIQRTQQLCFACNKRDPMLSYRIILTVVNKVLTNVIHYGKTNKNSCLQCNHSFWLTLSHYKHVCVKKKKKKLPVYKDVM